MRISAILPTVTHITEDIEYEIDAHLTILFRLSMWWRIFYGFLRIALGITLLRLVGQQLSEFIFGIMEHELTGKMSDVLLGKLYTLFEIHDFTITHFLALYFLFWGTVDIVLSFCLLHHIRKAFPIAMSIITLFILYGIFRFSYTHSLVLACIIVLDAVILYLINDEYILLKRRVTSNTSTPSDPLHRLS